LAFLSIPAAVYAQSAIVGVVKDNTGAVLPGVTVEAASDVLIEKVRSVTTDGAGQYRIIDLRPGTYIVTYTLAGFQTVRREGIQLPAEFTATLNVELRVGELAETITVTGDPRSSIPRRPCTRRCWIASSSTRFRPAAPCKAWGN
jgi:hypothetical protein